MRSKGPIRGLIITPLLTVPLLYTSMNEPLDTVEKNGHLYRYDPDYDCWYRVYRKEDYDNMPYWEKYGWLWVCLLCVVIATVATYTGH